LSNDYIRYQPSNIRAGGASCPPFFLRLRRRQRPSSFSFLLATSALGQDQNKIENAEAFTQSVEALNRGDFAGALQKLEPLAVKGYFGARMYLAIMYKEGWGVPQDSMNAYMWLDLAVMNGFTTAGTDVTPIAINVRFTPNYGHQCRHVRFRGVASTDRRNTLSSTQRWSV